MRTLLGRPDRLRAASRRITASSAGATSRASIRASPKPLAESLFELLDGENPTRIEHLWQKIYRAHRDIRGGPFMVHTLAGIDMALWDITGKLWDVPVYRLLGGPCRDRIRVYHTPKAREGAAARHLRALRQRRPTSSAWSRPSRRPARRSAPTAP